MDGRAGFGSTSIEAPETDLASHLAGGAARAKRDEINKQAPILHLAARLLGVHTQERSWRIGTKGELKVGRELERLPATWHTLHAVPVGERGSDIDHVVIGPAGVFTLNTKRHAQARAWVSERLVMVNGQSTQYIRNSRLEAKRATDALTDSCGFAVDASAVIVFVDLSDIKIRQQPHDVHVTTRHRLHHWLLSLPHRMTQPEVEAIYQRARNANTWRSHATAS